MNSLQSTHSDLGPVLLGALSEMTLDLSRSPISKGLQASTPEELTELELALTQEVLGNSSASSLVYSGACGRFKMMSTARADAYRAERQEAATRALLPAQRTLVDPALENACIVNGVGLSGFADGIAYSLGLPLTEIDYTTFANSEVKPEVRDSVGDKDVFLIQRVPAPVNEYIMHILLTIDALKGAGARTVTLVLPYFPYGRQDERNPASQSALSNEVVAKLLAPHIAGLITVDIHSPKTADYFPQGFYNVMPYDELMPYLAEQFRSEPIAAASPDEGGMNRSDVGNLSGKLLQAFGDDIVFANCKKSRGGPNQVKEMSLHIEDDESLKGRTALLFDDMLDTGGTVEPAATLLKEAGARKVVVVTTHPIGSRGAFERFATLTYSTQDNGEERLIDEIITTDSLPIIEPTKNFISVVSLAKPIADQILRVQRENVESRSDTASQCAESIA